MVAASGWIASAFERACLAELDVPKPGNVHRFAGGHGMEVEAFETSAAAAAPHIAASGAPVGARILGAVGATRRAVGVNTNLGILLLCAPLAHAAERGGPLRAAIRAVLDALTAADTADVFAAIALAAPGGLGTSDEADVSRAPTIGLVDAMRLAAGRDRIANAYADGFADLFATGLPAIAAARRAGAEAGEEALAAYLAFAARFPDSHVARKFGLPRAESVRERFAAFRDREERDPSRRHAALLAFDAALKAEGLNPGTSADFAVASLFAASILARAEMA